MKRRDVIKLGAVAAAGIGGEACVLPRKVATMRGADGAVAFNAMLDDQLGMLSKPGLLQRIVGNYTGKPVTDDVQQKLTAQDAMFRRLLSTVLLTQGFRELPLETQVHPAVQDRMWKHSDLIANTVFEIGDMLANLDETQRKNIQTTMRKEPDLAMTLGEALDDRAGRAGLSRSRRKQLRAMMQQTTFRLRDQHPAAVIDEYVDKVDRLRPTSPDHARAIDAAEELSERAFWRRQHLQLDDPNATGAPAPAPAAPAAPPPAAPTPPANSMVPQLTENARVAARSGDCRQVGQLGRYVKDLDPAYFTETVRKDPELRACLQQLAVFERPPPQQVQVSQPPPAAEPDPDDKPYPGQGAVRAGGYMLGIGLVVGLISAAAVNASFGFVFGVTLGVLLVGIGLLTLLIGALIYATS